MAVSVLGFFALPGTFSTFEGRQGFITERTLAGVFMSPNALSVVGAVVAVFALARLLKTPKVPHRTVLWMGILFGVTAVVLASGRQGLIILVVSAAAVQLISKPFRAVLWVLPAVVAFWFPLCERVGDGLYPRPRISTPAIVVGADCVVAVGPRCMAGASLAWIRVRSGGSIRCPWKDGVQPCLKRALGLSRGADRCRNHWVHPSRHRPVRGGKILLQGDQGRERIRHSSDSPGPAHLHIFGLWRLARHRLRDPWPSRRPSRHLGT